MSSPAEMTSVTGQRIAGHLQAKRGEILRSWEAAVRALPRARGLDRPTLVDHIPDLLDRIADLTEELARGDAATLRTAVAERHAIARLEEGFDLVEVIT